MQIYLFFKTYYIALGKNIALFLSKKGISPNTASIWSLLVIFPMFYLLDYFVNDIVLFFILLFFAINIKLILNAIDGIIAREQHISTRLWMFLNVATDMIPDMYIIYLILSKLQVAWSMIVTLLWVIWIYFLIECVIIFLYHKQNIFLWGKESRTFFYLFIFGVYFFDWSYSMLVYFYILILFIHHVWFFISKSFRAQNS